MLALISNGVRVPTATAGQDVEVILDRSPLYAESGGQIADIGTITANGLRVRSTTCRRSPRRYGSTGLGDRGTDHRGRRRPRAGRPEWRKGATQGHSGTHMVHAALRQVLGPNAVQAGSLNKPGYLRFDFNWQGQLSESQKQEIEVVTNEAVAANHAVNTFVTDLDKAKQMGAMALFGENYGDEVRVVEIGGPFSMELCGGTHSADVGADRSGHAAR